jgi:hypothetical protein
MEIKDLQCESSGKKLLFLVYSWIGIVIIISIHTLYTLIDPMNAKKYDLSVGVVGIIGIINIISLIIFFALWVYKLHKDCNSIFPNYSISPKKSLQLTLIPIYNAWGIWKIAKELFLEFKINEINLSWANIKIQNLYIIMLVCGGIDNAISKITTKTDYVNYDFQSKVVIESLSFIVSLISPILWYIIITLAMNGMKKVLELSRSKKLY